MPNRLFKELHASNPGTFPSPLTFGQSHLKSRRQLRSRWPASGVETAEGDKERGGKRFILGPRNPCPLVPKVLEPWFTAPYPLGYTMLFFTLLLEVIWTLAADGGHHWAYEGPHGQDHWPVSYPECGSNAQSPIDIQTDSVTFDPTLPALQPYGYDQLGTEPLDLHNNGHTGKSPGTKEVEGPFEILEESQKTFSQLVNSHKVLPIGDRRMVIKFP
ncbi:PREDICTED: carbonic anhydrase 14 [Dipodomys ordii]|uniref:Carbonic anhydrase 14 n=1 Tax=Dipodomys ordii TaxID=10020 RepID=A0A1S3F2K8_DIPOR|nr:PREDICTED: carbonic anhydrase 14 [Dipodomys ordii]